MADRLHLQPKHRRALDALLRNHLPDVEVWAYGSRVTGHSHDGSDLDLVLRAAGLKEVPAGKLADFEDAVRESTIPFLVEARDWARLPDRFHQEIERNYVVVSGSRTPKSEWRSPAGRAAVPEPGRQAAATTDGLKDEHREAIIAVIAANDRVERAVLFGSRATGTNTVSSAVDIALFGDRLTLTDQTRLAVAFDEIPMAQKVDLVLYDSIRDHALRKQIRRDGVEWYPDLKDGSDQVTLASAIGTGDLSGPLPSDWERSTLGEACERSGGNIQTGPFGSQLHASDYRPEGIPSIMPQNLGDNRVIEEGIARIGELDASRLRRYLVREGDIVYSRRGDVEKRALIGPREDGWLCGTGCLRVRLGENGVDPTYASYYLGHPAVREWIVRHAHGATMPNLNTAILSACPFVVPPLSEQRYIAHVLGTLDDKIELNRRMSATLEAMARALFKSWFVDFDPVRAKMEGRDTGLPKHIVDLFPERIANSGRRRTPRGWAVGTLSDAVELYNGGTPRRSVDGYWNGGIPWYTAKDAPSLGEVFVLETERTITRVGLENSAATILPARTAIITARGTVGKLACLGREMAMNQTCYGIRGSCGYPDYFTYWLVRNMMQELQSRAHGTIFDTITRQTFDVVEVVLPPTSVATAFEEIVRPVMEHILRNLQESRTVSSLRDVLLPKLISGELLRRFSERVPRARPYG